MIASGLHGAAEKTERGGSSCELLKRKTPADASNRKRGVRRCRPLIGLKDRPAKSHLSEAGTLGRLVTGPLRLDAPLK